MPITTSRQRYLTLGCISYGPFWTFGPDLTDLQRPPIPLPKAAPREGAAVGVGKSVRSGPDVQTGPCEMYLTVNALAVVLINLTLEVFLLPLWKVNEIQGRSIPTRRDANVAHGPPLSRVGPGPLGAPSGREGLWKIGLPRRRASTDMCRADKNLQRRPKAPPGQKGPSGRSIFRWPSRARRGLRARRADLSPARLCTLASGRPKRRARSARRRAPPVRASTPRSQRPRRRPPPGHGTRGADGLRPSQRGSPRESGAEPGPPGPSKKEFGNRPARAASPPARKWGRDLFF